MKQLKKFEFKSASVQSKYPWDAILDGRINVLTKGEDYDVDTLHMAPKIKTAARRRYKTVKTSLRDADGKKLEDQIIVQAFDMNDEERAAEDARREQEKADRKAAGESETAASEAA